MNELRDFLEVRLMTIGDSPIVVGDLVTVAVIMAVTVLVSIVVRRVLERILRRGGIQDVGLLGTVGRLLHYLILVIGSGVALDTIGIELSTLFAAGAVVGIALGFALQNILQNFVSGIILLAERSITPADVLEVDGRIVRVTAMGIRRTVARTRDEEEIIIPNSVLVQSTVKNFTLGDSLYRVRTRVGVTYDTDLERANQVISEAAASVRGRHEGHDPTVLFWEFGDSALVFDASIWIADPWFSPASRSALNFAIWRALKEAGIVVAFPQLDLHVKAVPGGPPPEPRPGRTSAA